MCCAGSWGFGRGKKSPVPGVLVVLYGGWGCGALGILSRSSENTPQAKFAEHLFYALR
jgi:hypothetical protein